MVKKFDALAEELARKTVLKVEVRRLRRQAREEVRALKKAGAQLRDANTLEIYLRDDQWLLEHASNIRRAVQAQATIVIRKASNGAYGTANGQLLYADEIRIDYDVFKEAQENVASYNRKVDAWNRRHAEEIKKGLKEKRRHKAWSVASRMEETQETADVWFAYTNKFYSPTSSYGEGKWADYLTSIMKAVVRRAPVGMDWIIEFFDRNLPEKVPKDETDWFNFEEYYVTSRTDRFEAYRKLAVKYGLAQEWHDLMLAHKKEVDDFTAWI